MRIICGQKKFFGTAAVRTAPFNERESFGCICTVAPTWYQVIDPMYLVPRTCPLSLVSFLHWSWCWRCVGPAWYLVGPYLASTQLIFTALLPFVQQWPHCHHCHSCCHIICISVTIVNSGSATIKNGITNKNNVATRMTITSLAAIVEQKVQEGCKDQLRACEVGSYEVGPTTQPIWRSMQKRNQAQKRTRRTCLPGGTIPGTRWPNDSSLCRVVGPYSYSLIISFSTR